MEIRKKLAQYLAGYLTSFSSRRLLVKLKYITIGKIVDSIIVLRKLKIIIFFLLVFIVLFFGITVYQLSCGGLSFEKAIAPIIFSLSALLASFVAVSNMRQNYLIEVTNTTMEDVDTLRLLSVLGMRLQNHIMSIRPLLTSEKHLTKSFLQEIYNYAKAYEETMFQKGVMRLINNTMIHDGLRNIFFDLKIIMGSINHTIDARYKETTIASNLCYHDEECFFVKTIDGFIEKHVTFLNELNEITDNRGKHLRKLIKLEG